MYETIIVPLDLSVPHPAAVGLAEALSHRSGAPVRVVTVSSPGLDHEEDEHALEKLADYVDAADVRTEVIDSNDVPAALLDVAGADGLLCLETRARGPLSSIVLGSVAAGVLRKATRPVLLVGPDARPDPALELLEVCIDGPDAAAALVPVAGEWARRFRVRPRLLSVWVPGQLRRFRTPEAAEELLAGVASRLAEELRIDVDWEVVEAAAAPAAIVEDAERHLASVVAVAVRPHPRLQRVLGSVAMAVAHSSGAAVLAVPCEPAAAVAMP